MVAGRNDTHSEAWTKFIIATFPRKRKISLRMFTKYPYRIHTHQAATSTSTVVTPKANFRFY